MPLVQTRGAASAQGFGEFAQASAVPNYIEEVFSCFLYTGTGATKTITNEIDLSTKGGMVWIKNRTFAGSDHNWFDTARGATKRIKSNNTDGQLTTAGTLDSFNTTGFTLGSQSGVNFNTYLHASWTFRKQPKFFDVVTYTGTGSNTTIAHSLGSVPACIIVKRTDTTGAWQVYHRSLANTEYLSLNTTAAVATGATRWNSTTPTSTVFSIGTDATVNASGGTYVAYIFAHDAGGFGLTGTDNVISCGSYTGNGSATGPEITLGYEPQWLMIKKAVGGTGNWQMLDNMRGIPVGSDDAALRANLTSAEAPVEYVSPTSTGFQITSTSGEVNTNTSTYIYIAIRRGPMKVPTSGTSVFIPVATTGVAGDVNVTTNFPVDLLINHRRNDGAGNNWWSDRLRGPDTLLRSNTTDGEATGYYPDYPKLNQTTVTYPDDPSQGFWNYPTYTYINWFFKRAPSFMDVVCYNGDGTDNRAIAHNLTVVPEFIIAKRRDGPTNWICYCQYITGGASSRVFLQSTAASVTSINDWAATNPTSTNFFISSTSSAINNSGNTYVSYLFATCAGVSKVGSYTGTGTTLQVNCGFTAGARFVLIRRTSTGGGDWYVWDTERGIVSGNDPYLLLNSIAAEATSTDYIDTYSAGFEISSTAPAAINGSGGLFIFLAIA
jgi:hypothetical protein